MKLLFITPTLNEALRLKEHLDITNARIKFVNKSIVCDTLYIDGGSSDSTVDLLRDENHMSLPGSSIYEAFNAGIHYAFRNKFDHVVFLGVGDKILENFRESLQNIVVNKADNKHDFLVFSDFFWKDNKRLPSRLSLQNGLMGFPHSGTIFPLFVFRDNVFDVNYSIVGDLDWLLRSFEQLKACDYYKIIEPIVQLEVGGVSMSKRSRFRHLTEYMSVCVKHRIFPSIRLILHKLIM